MTKSSENEQEKKCNKRFQTQNELKNNKVTFKTWKATMNSYTVPNVPRRAIESYRRWIRRADFECFMVVQLNVQQSFSQERNLRLDHT